MSAQWSVGDTKYVFTESFTLLQEVCRLFCYPSVYYYIQILLFLQYFKKIFLEKIYLLLLSHNLIISKCNTCLFYFHTVAMQVVYNSIEIFVRINDIMQEILPFGNIISWNSVNKILYFPNVIWVSQWKQCFPSHYIMAIFLMTSQHTWNIEICASAWLKLFEYHSKSIFN